MIRHSRRRFLLAAPLALAGAPLVARELWTPSTTIFLPPKGGWMIWRVPYQIDFGDSIHPMHNGIYFYRQVWDNYVNGLSGSLVYHELPSEQMAAYNVEFREALRKCLEEIKQIGKEPIIPAIEWKL